jgi:multiple sugar transport system permease protein
MARRGLSVVAIISFTAAWNEFMMPLVLLSSNNKFPAAVILSNFVRWGGAHRSVLKYSIGDLAAFVILYILPTIILAIISRKSILKIVGSGVKL